MVKERHGYKQAHSALKSFSEHESFSVRANLAKTYPRQRKVLLLSRHDQGLRGVCCCDDRQCQIASAKERGRDRAQLRAKSQQDDLDMA